MCHKKKGAEDAHEWMTNLLEQKCLMSKMEEVGTEEKKTSRKKIKLP